MKDAARAALIAEIAKAVREEMRLELILAGIGQPPEHWADIDRRSLAARLRAAADEMDP